MKNGAVWIAVAATCIVLLAACDGGPIRTAPASQSTQLETAEGDGLGTPPLGGCGSSAFGDLKVGGDQRATPAVWLEDPNTGEVVHVVWPAGFSATFDPTLVIYDARRRVVAREGDILSGVSGFPDRPDRPALILSFNGTNYPCQ